MSQAATSIRYVWHRVKSELHAEISRNYLSYLWWLLEPCLTIAVFYVIFGMLFNRGGEDFVSFLLLGVTAWLWFAHTVMRASQSIRSELTLMLQVYVPKYVFPLVAVMFGLFKHLFVIIVLVGLLLLFNDPLDTWGWYLLIFLVQLLLILAVSLIIAAIVPFLPDLTLIIPPIMQLGMFVSGIFFAQSMIPAHLVPYFRYNPMAGLIMEYRKVMLYGQAPDLVYLGKVSLICMLTIALGLWILRRFDRIYPRMTH